MNRIPKARYSKERRQKAVELAKAVGPSETSQRLSIPLKTLAKLDAGGKRWHAGRDWPTASGHERGGTGAD
jgi:hypothetical protein